MANDAKDNSHYRVTETGTRIYECQSWDDFIAKVRLGDGKYLGGYVFRGHAKRAWKLSSIWERWLEEKWNGRRNRPPDSYLSKFREMAIGIPGLNTDSLTTDDEWWALGRHHGLITPLLDWTRSPYIAAYFAFFDWMEIQNPGFKNGMNARSVSFGSFESEMSHVAVWALPDNGEFEQEGEFKFIKTKKDNFYRQLAQQGVFTRLDYAQNLDLESYFAIRGVQHHLELYTIPSVEAGKALADLELMGISYGTLFPDLNGIAAQANLDEGRRFWGV